jgi:membrane protease subunit HflK
MAWNEPGGNQDNQNPWGRGNKPASSDFQKFLQEFKKHLQQLGGKPPQKSPAKWQKLRQFLSSYGHYAIPGVLLAVWLLAGITMVDSGEQAVVLKLGKFNRTLNSGIHWVPPLLEKVYTIPQQQINAVTFTGNVVTGDEQVLAFALNVQYRIADPKAYLFAVADPEQSLEDAVASSIYQVMSKQTTTDLLADAKQELNQQLLVTLNNSLKSMNPGFVVTDISIQSLDVPAAVTDARTDALKAQQDSQQVVNQAQDNASQLLTQAQAQAQQLMSDAKAYQQKVVLKAQGDTVRYLALLPEYQQNPQVTRERLYVETMQHILGKVTKVLVDVPTNSHVQINVPLAAALASATATAPTEAATSADGVHQSSTSAPNATDGIAGYGSDTDANSY